MLQLNKRLFLILFLIAIPVIIYFYFLKWKTNTIYGDDLYMFNYLSKGPGISEMIRLTAVNGKFRPMEALTVKLIFVLFNKHLFGYYLFNVFIQTINTYLLALLLNLFLRRLSMSLFISLIYGLSRFSFYDLVDIFNGGALEGLAVAFFLLSIFFILKVLVNRNLSGEQKKAAFLWSILFANLSMYTHERYIVVFPFIILILLFFPGLKVLSKKQKILFATLAILSVALNVVLKKFVYPMPFFMGTGSTVISFSFSSAISFFTDGLLSIFQVNSGPAYVTGFPFTSLWGGDLFITLLVIGSSLEILLLYVLRAPEKYRQRDEAQKLNYLIVLFLSILFVFCLVPAVVTIRLEQRWLQASFSVFILIIVIAFNSLQFKNARIKNVLFSFYILLFLWSGHNYLKMGADVLYMKDAERSAAVFRQAINNGTIRPNTTKLYVWEKHKNMNADIVWNWTLGDGYFFEFYNQKSKQLIFVDSLYEKSGDSVIYSFIDFNKDSTQIICISSKVADVTNDYLKDSLRSFKFE